jgi:hypothetical protein
MKANLLADQSGFITVDFVFSMVLILGMSGLLFVLTFALSMASVTQYVTFAVARTYEGANIDQDAQTKLAQQKYQELLNSKVLKPLYTNGWFTVDADATLGDQTKVVKGWGGDKVNEFWGAGTHFIARILDFHIPFFGSTNPDGDGTGSNFAAYMSSNLGREPTTKECLDFTARRWETILKLPSSAGASYSSGANNSKYFPMTDNGC